MIEKSHRWHRTAVAATAIALLGLTASEVSALSLGRITVQSALGEPLKAEIEVPNISDEEATSLKTTVASPAAFVAAGLEYNPAMSSLQISLARRADGHAYIRLSSDRAINDPFIDLILEASWSSGRIVRDYTMLFDPPSLKQAAPAPTLAQTPATVTASVPAKPAPIAAAAAELQTHTPANSKSATPVAATGPAHKPAATEAKRTGQQVVVKPGDSASKIAAQVKTGDVSLDQMLVALLRANPDAFSKGNLNRLRAGAVLDLPSSDQAQSISPTEATQTVIAQSKDFNEFRRNLAASAPKTTVEAANRKATGKVEARVEEKKPSSAAVDKLTLSKGALQAKEAEAKLAKERAEKDAAARAAELAKNIADLNKISAASAKQAAQAAAPTATASEAKPQPTVPAVAVASSKVPVAAAPVASAPVAAPAKPVASAAKASPAPAPAPEPSLIDQFIEDPVLPLAGGGLLAALGGFFFYRRRLGKKNTAHVDSSFLDSHLKPDSFFGSSGGQQVDTAQDGTSPSSLGNYSNSQLGSPDDVDPVAEADVYLAYGRDMQAEEILKEALKHTPDRVAIHSKLLDIYVKRRDAAGFLATANNVFKLVGADSPEWARICELGLTIDPENSLYQPGGATASAFVSLEQSQNTEPGALSALEPGLNDVSHTSTDLDLDLDFSADEVAQHSAPTESPSASIEEAGAEQTVKMNALNDVASNSLDFDIPELHTPEPPQASATAPETPPDMATQLATMSLSLDDLTMDAPTDTVPAAPDFSLDLPGLPEPEAKVAEAAPAKASDGMLEFDLGSLSLDLDANPPQNGDAGSDNSLETKLALAEEFVSIGDQDGARALIEEVVSEATGELRAKAQRALASLS